MRVPLVEELCLKILEEERRFLHSRVDNERIHRGEWEKVKHYRPVFAEVRGDRTEVFDEKRRIRETNLDPCRVRTGAVTPQRYATLGSIRDCVAHAMCNLFGVEVVVTLKSVLASLGGGIQQGYHHDSEPVDAEDSTYKFPEYALILNIDPSSWARLSYYPRSHLLAELDDEDIEGLDISEHSLYAHTATSGFAEGTIVDLALIHAGTGYKVKEHFRTYFKISGPDFKPHKFEGNTYADQKSSLILRP